MCLKVSNFQYSTIFFLLGKIAEERVSVSLHLYCICFALIKCVIRIQILWKPLEIQFYRPDSLIVIHIFLTRLCLFLSDLKSLQIATPAVEE